MRATDGATNLVERALLLRVAASESRRLSSESFPSQAGPGLSPQAEAQNRLMLWVPQSTQNKTTIPKKRIQTERKLEA